MLNTLTVAALLSLTPAQGDGLSVSNARLTYGILGPTRTDTKFLPGDQVVIGFSVEGVVPDETGKATYSSALQMTDGNGKVVFQQPAREATAFLPLGGGSFPAFARVDLGMDQSAGEYTLQMSISGKNGKGNATQKFTVVPHEFGLVRLTATCDPEGIVPAGVLSVGRNVWFHATILGFGRDGASKQPNVTLETRVLDERGKPTMQAPFRTTINKNVPAGEPALPLQHLVPLNRAGKFTVEIKATDVGSGKSATQRYPLTVQSAN